MEKSDLDDSHYVKIDDHITIQDRMIILFKAIFSPALAFFVNQIIMTINLYYISLLDNTEIFDGVGFGSTWINLTCNGVMVCLNVGFIAIASQAHGSKSNELLGLYFHRAIIIDIIAFVPCAIFIINCESILIFLNISPIIARYATGYMISLLPSTFIYIFVDTAKNFCFAKNHFFGPVIIQLIVSIIHPLWCHFFLVKLGMGVYGVSVGITITMALHVAFLIWYIHNNKIGGESWFWFNPKSFQNLYGQFVKEFFIGFILYLEWLAFEGSLLIAGSLSETEMAAQVIFFTFICFTFAMTYGLGVAVNTYISNSMGKGSKDEAVAYLKAGIILSSITAFIPGSILFIFIDNLASIYTSDIEVIEILRSAAFVYVITFPGNVVQALFSATLRAIALEKTGAKAFLIAFYLFGLPASYIFGIVWGWGIPGIWWGLALGAHILLALQIRILLKLDWDRQLGIIQQNLLKDNKQIDEAELVEY